MLAVSHTYLLVSTHKWFRASVCTDVYVEVSLLKKALVAIGDTALVPFAISQAISRLFVLFERVSTYPPIVFLGNYTFGSCNGGVVVFLA